jgi:ATP-dependent exoDNAse (exonuclease V) beta subunit
LEEILPGEETWMESARRVAPGMAEEAVTALWAEFQRWLEPTEIRSLFLRESYPEGARVATELPFAARVGNRILRGRMDRVILIHDRGTPVRAEVVDFKTDALHEGGDRGIASVVERYRPQLVAYRRVLESMYSLGIGRVDARLAFLRSGQVVAVE